MLNGYIQRQTDRRAALVEFGLLWIESIRRCQLDECECLSNWIEIYVIKWQFVFLFIDMHSWPLPGLDMTSGQKVEREGESVERHRCRSIVKWTLDIGVS